MKYIQIYLEIIASLPLKLVFAILLNYQNKLKMPQEQNLDNCYI
ncbi:hypothetical protein M084_4271, partial [Bacteroides fragilis str. 3988 T1]